MTDEQKNRIATMRESGYGYAAIAEVLGVSKNTIKHTATEMVWRVFVRNSIN